MTRFDRYVMRVLTMTTLTALLFLLCIDFLLQSADQAGDIGKGHYTFTVLLVVLFYALPEKLLLFAPAATLIGAIMGLGQLAAQNELAVVQASGVSRFRVVRGALLLACLSGVVLLALEESVVPDWSAKSTLLRNQALGRAASLSTREGMWLHTEQGMMHIGRVNADGSLGAIQRMTPHRDGADIMQAATAQFVDGAWQLHDSHTLHIDPDAATVSVGDSVWRSGLTPDNLTYLLKQNPYPTLVERYRQIHFLRANGLNADAQSLIFWQKLLLPLAVVTMVLLSLPFVFTRGRSANRGTRLIIGILLGVAFYVCQGMLANLTLILGWPPLLGAGLPIVLFAVPAWLLLRR